MFKKIGSFLKAVSTEMTKVSWPSRSQIIRSTVIVLIVVVVFGIFIGGVDILFLQILNVFVG